MKTIPLQNKIEFRKLLSLFKPRSNDLFILTRPHGKGYAQILDLEKGLQARFWNFCFYHEREIYNDIDCKDDNCYFTLAFFLNTRGILFANEDVFFDENSIWDTI